MRWRVAAVVALAASASTDARADEDVESKARCRASYEQAQTLRREGKLTASRAQLVICQASCPAALSHDCARWIREVDALIPTVRLRARDEGGEPVIDPIVAIDGRAVAVSADGSVPVEPGVHMLSVRRGGGPETSVRFEVFSGERDHLIDVIVPSRVGAIPVADSPAPRERTASYVVGGFGIVALAAGGALGIKGHVDRSDLRETCAPICPERDVDAIRTTWYVAVGAAIVGAAAFGAAALLWPRAPRSSAAALSSIRW